MKKIADKTNTISKMMASFRSDIKIGEKNDTSQYVHTCDIDIDFAIDKLKLRIFKIQGKYKKKIYKLYNEFEKFFESSKVIEVSLETTDLRSKLNDRPRAKLSLSSPFSIIVCPFLYKYKYCIIYDRYIHIFLFFHIL